MACRTSIERRVWAVAVALGLCVVAPAVEAQQVVKLAAGVPLTAPLAKQGQEVADRGLKNTNRVCARDDAQGPAGAIFAVQDLKAKKIAVFDDGTTGPKGVADEVEKKAKQLGAQPMRYVIRSGDKDFRAILATVPKDVSVIYASLWAPDAALIDKQPT